MKSCKNSLKLIIIIKGFETLSPALLMIYVIDVLQHWLPKKKISFGIFM